MWWQSIFRKKHNRKARKTNRSPKLFTLFEKLQSETLLLQTNVQSLQTRVNQHDAILSSHTTILEEQKVRVAKLEQLVDSGSTNLPQKNTPQIGLPESYTRNLSQRHNINDFSIQEKRILQLFFEHPGMTLSYNDIAKALNKSPHTVKNQINQLTIKADLFTKTIGTDNRNRLKLKDGLHLEKFLKL